MSQDAVEAAARDLQQDRRRLEWLLPVISGAMTDPVGNLRTQALAVALREGFEGRLLIDRAMTRCKL